MGDSFLGGYLNPLELVDAFSNAADSLTRAGLLASKLAVLHRVYVSDRTATRRQARARERIRERGHTLDTLIAIETQAAKITNVYKRWKARLELAACPPDVGRIKAAGAKLAEQLNAPPPEPQPAVSHRNIAGSTLSRLTITAPAHLVKAAADALEHADIPAAVANLASGEGSGGPLIHTRVIIGGKDIERIQRGEGGDVLLSTTSGQQMTGLDYVNSRIARKLKLLLFGPSGDFIAMYDGAFENDRFAPAVMREVVDCKDPVCCVDGCMMPAEKCQVNHNLAWAMGGKTRLDNLSNCCAFHNGRLDVDPADRRFGTIVQRGGRNLYHPPWLPCPQRNSHPCAAGGAVDILYRNWV